MKLIIDIPEEVKHKVYAYGLSLSPSDKEQLIHAIMNGIPLPKGHGELIDRDKIEYLKAIHDAKYGYITWGDASKLIKYSAPTIIEADKAESEVSNG